MNSSPRKSHCPPRAQVVQLGQLTTILLLVAGLILLTGCEINKPEMPTFDSSVTIPLGVERVEIMDLVADEEFLVVGGDSSLAFSMSGDPDTLDFNFDLGTSIASQSISQGLGNFALPAQAPMNYGFQLQDIWPAAAGLNNQVVMVPPFPINVSSSTQDIPNIDSAVLASGSVAMTVVNNLAVPISANSGPDQIILSLMDPRTGTSFGALTFPEIPSGGTSTQTADLTGVNLPGTLYVNLAGGSPGSSGSLVTVSGTDDIAIDAAFTDLVVSSASAVVEAQTFNTSFDTALPADYTISSAIVGSGSVNLSLTNALPVPCTAVLTWADLQNLAGQPLTSVFDLPAGQALSRGIDFSGYVLDAGGAPLTQLTATVDITTPGSGGTPVMMNAGDGLTADITGGSIAFSSVTGVVPVYQVALDPITEQIDLPDELDGVEFTSTTMVLSMTNSTGLPGDLNLTLTGTSAAGQVRTLSVAQTIAPAIDRAPVTTPIILDETNSDIVNFLNNLPEIITLTGSVDVGGNGQQGTVRADDYAVVSWELNAPLEIIINGSVVGSDPKLVDLDQDMRDMINDHSLGAYIQTEILNHFPVGVELRILAGTDTLTLADSPLLTIGPLTVDAAAVDPITHTVSEGMISRPVIDLTAEQSRIFSLPGLATMVEVTLPSTQGNPVRMMSSDFLEVRGIVQVDVHVNDQW